LIDMPGPPRDSRASVEFQAGRWIGVEFTDSAPEGKKLSGRDGVFVSVAKSGWQPGLAQHGAGGLVFPAAETRNTGNGDERFTAPNEVAL